MFLALARLSLLGWLKLAERRRLMQFVSDINPSTNGVEAMVPETALLISGWPGSTDLAHSVGS